MKCGKQKISYSKGNDSKAQKLTAPKTAPSNKSQNALNRSSLAGNAIIFASCQDCIRHKLFPKSLCSLWRHFASFSDAFNPCEFNQAKEIAEGEAFKRHVTDKTPQKDDNSNQLTWTHDWNTVFSFSMTKSSFIEFIRVKC